MQMSTCRRVHAGEYMQASTCRRVHVEEYMQREVDGRCKSLCIRFKPPLGPRIRDAPGHSVGKRACRFSRRHAVAYRFVAEHL